MGLQTCPLLLLAKKVTPAALMEHARPPAPLLRTRGMKARAGGCASPES